MSDDDDSFEYYEATDAEYQPVVYEKKKATIWQKMGGGALTIAILFHVILLVLGAFWVLQVIREPEKKVDFMPNGGGGGGGGERSMQTKVQQKKRAQITPSTNVKRVFAEGASSNFAIPDPGDTFGERSSLSSLSGSSTSGMGGAGSGGGFGSGSGGGKGNGNGFGFGGAGAGKLFGLIPETMRKRCSKEDRLQRLSENGGTPQCEEAVVKGLRWLKTQQNADGSWGEKNRASMTGLALLAYFGHCETPVSEEFGESCMKGIVYLVNLGVKNEGKISTQLGAKYWPYEHAIGTYALGEATTFCKDLKIDVPNLTEVTTQAGQYIIDHQHESGGWEYNYQVKIDNRSDDGELKRGGDVSVAGWQIQALKACTHTGIKYRGMSGCINRALEYLAKCQNENGGFGYTLGKNPSGGLPYFSLTGVGMLCNQMWGKGGRSEVRKAADYISANSKLDYNGPYCDLYAHYYESQAMMQKGGEFWDKYNKMFRDQIVNNQGENGSWKRPGEKINAGKGEKMIAVAAKYADANPEGEIYRTCLCSLMLEVYYRFLSTDEGGATKKRGI